MSCPRCQTNNPASARFCMHCGQALALVCASCQTELPPGARFCMHCGQPVIASTPADETRLTRLVAATPKSLARKVRAATHLLGERRVVTALFVDVVGSTALSAQVDVETWTAIMNGAFDSLAPVIYRYEGTIARLVGDSLLAFFGAPVAHEDDPIRAVHAALELIAAGREYAVKVRQQHNVDFAIRACINTGQVIVGAVRDDLRFEFTAMGGALNLASRIKFAAQPMTVLVSENTYRFVAPLFDCTDLGSISIKGLSAPVHVYQVDGRKVRPEPLRGVAGLTSAMVGRDAELEALDRLCVAVRAGVGRAALIVGEPGLGKTRLIREWQAALEAGQLAMDDGIGSVSVQWVEGSCLSYGQELAYHLLVDLLRSIIGMPEAASESETRAALHALTDHLFGESAMEVYPYLGHLLSLNLTEAAHEQVQLLDPEALRTHYLDAFRSLLLALSQRCPLLIVLEDLQWADPSSVKLLVRLLPLALGAPILFCLVTRPERDVPGWQLVTAAREVIGRSLTELTLKPLAERDSRQLVANMLRIQALPIPMQQTILKKAEGNPLFVEEVIRMLIDRGALIQRNGDWVVGAEIDGMTIPDSLQGLLLARIDRLPDNVKTTLRVAAVIGRQFPVKLLAEVLGEEETV